MADQRSYEHNLDDLPAHFHMTDGHPLTVRLIQPEDASLLLDLFERLSPETRRRRFHAETDYISDERKAVFATRLANVDNHTQGGALLAIDEQVDAQGNALRDTPANAGPLVAVARLARPEGVPDADVAEAAIVVCDDYQRKGIGTELLWRLVLLAKRMNIQTMIGEIEADNGPALKLFRSLELPTESTTHHAETILHIAIPADN